MPDPIRCNWIWPAPSDYHYKKKLFFFLLQPFWPSTTRTNKVLPDLVSVVGKKKVFFFKPPDQAAGGRIGLRAAEVPNPHSQISHWQWQVSGLGGGGGAVGGKGGIWIFY